MTQYIAKIVYPQGEERIIPRAILISGRVIGHTREGFQLIFNSFLVARDNLKEQIVEDLANGLLFLADAFGDAGAKADKATGEYESHRSKINELKGELGPLIDRYEDLKGRTNLTDEEQVKLRDTIQQIAEIVPSAATEFDKYGNALDVSTDKAQRFIEAQKIILKQKNADAISAQEEAVSRLRKEQIQLNQALNNFNEQGDLVKERIEAAGKAGPGGFQPIRKEVKLTNEEIAGLQQRLNEVTKEIEARRDAISSLSGEFRLQADDPQAVKDLAKDFDDQIEVIKEKKDEIAQELAIVGYDQDLKDAYDQLTADQIRLEEEKAKAIEEKRKELTEDATPITPDPTPTDKDLEKLEKQLDKQKEALEEAFRDIQKSTETFDREAYLESLTPEEREVQEVKDEYAALFGEITTAQIQFQETLANLRTRQLDDPENEELQAEIDYYESLNEKLTFQRLEFEKRMRKEVNELREKQAREAGEAIDQDLAETGDEQAEDTASFFEDQDEKDKDVLADIGRIFGPEQSELDAEIDRINAHYDRMLELAGDNAEARKRIEEERQRELMDIRMRYFEAQANAVSSQIGTVADAIGQIYRATGEKHEALLAFQKALTATQIAIDTASAISSIIRAAATAPNFFAALGQIASGVATVITNIARAKQLLSGAEVPSAPQRKEGGWYDHDQEYGSRPRRRNKGGYYDVMGRDDGKRYRARYLHEKVTGMLPDRPVVLASEKGAEYFVSHQSLRNPEVVRHVRAIENIERYGTEYRRVPQFQEGGSTDKNSRLVTTEQTQVQTSDEEVSSRKMLSVLEENTAVIRLLYSLLESGIDARAVIGDEQLVEGERRLNQLDNASGGFLRK